MLQCILFILCSHCMRETSSQILCKTSPKYYKYVAMCQSWGRPNAGLGINVWFKYAPPQNKIYIYRKATQLCLPGVLIIISISVLVILSKTVATISPNALLFRNPHSLLFNYYYFFFLRPKYYIVSSSFSNILQDRKKPLILGTSSL